MPYGYANTGLVTLTSTVQGAVTRHRFNWTSAGSAAILNLKPAVCGFCTSVTVANTDAAASTSNSLYLYDDLNAELTLLWPLTGVAVNSTYWQMMYGQDAFAVPLSLLPYFEISVFRMTSTTTATFGTVDVYMVATP